MSERSIATGYRSAAILSLGGDTERAVAALLEPVDNVYRLIDWEIMGGDGLGALPTRLSEAARRLGARLNRPLWTEDAPLVDDPSPALGLALGHVVAVADPIPPLRVWVAGLSAGQSLSAVQRALTGAFCEPVALYAMQAATPVAALAQELAQLAPQAVIVVGGYDRLSLDARQSVAALAQQISAAVGQLPLPMRPALYFAGNRWAAPAVLQIWRGLEGVDAQALANVLPSPGQPQTESVAVALSQLYRAVCKRDAALSPIAHWVTQPAVLRSAALELCPGRAALARTRKPGRSPRPLLWPLALDARLGQRQRGGGACAFFAARQPFA